MRRALGPDSVLGWMLWIVFALLAFVGVRLLVQRLTA